MEREIPGACPLDCPDGCSWVVTVRDGEAVRLRGNPDHPFTRGALCAKVARYLDHTRTPDRLLHPLRRVGAKGEGRFERIGWDDALGEIAERLLAIRERHGGEAIWPFQGTGTLGYLQGLEGRAGARLWNVLGASEHIASICSIAGSDGLRYTTGTNRGHGPGGVPAREADPALGLEPAHEPPPHLEVHRGGASTGRAPRRDRPGPHAHARARRTSTSRRGRAPTPRSRSG